MNSFLPPQAVSGPSGIANVGDQHLWNQTLALRVNIEIQESTPFKHWLKTWRMMALLLLCSFTTQIRAQEAVKTIAGTGIKGYQGDGGKATDAQINLSESVFAAPGGYLYVSDTDNGVIRRINPDGTMGTVATFGLNLQKPGGCAMDGAANLYVADSAMNCVLRIDPKGRCERFAGTGQAGYSGDGGPASEATLKTPASVIIGHNGELIIADTGNNRVRRVDPPTGLITTIAGTGNATSEGDNGPAANASLNAPWGLAGDQKGGIFVSEWSGNRIRYVNPAGQISTKGGTGTAGFAGDGGPASKAQFSGPRALALDSGGTLFVADHWNNSIRAVSPDDRVSTVPLTTSALKMASGVAVDAQSNLLVADSWHYRVLSLSKVATPGMFCTAAFPSPWTKPMPGNVNPTAWLMEMAHDFDGENLDISQKIIGGSNRLTSDLEGTRHSTLG